MNDARRFADGPHPAFGNWHGRHVWSGSYNYAAEPRKPTMARCCACKQVLPATLEHFYKTASRWNGLSGYCKPCHNAVSYRNYRARLALRPPKPAPPVPWTPGELGLCGIPLGLCQCGCGQHTRLSPHTDAARDTLKGRPRQWCMGHYKHHLTWEAEETCLHGHPRSQENELWSWRHGKRCRRCRACDNASGLRRYYARQAAKHALADAAIRRIRGEAPPPAPGALAPWSVARDVRHEVVV